MKKINLSQVTRLFAVGKRILYNLNAISQIKRQLDDNKILFAKTLIENQKQVASLKKIEDAEFKVFSQYGDDGIIQYLIDRVEISRQIFVEFGVQDYTESNTRFLLINNNWQGLIFDCSQKYIDFIQADEIYWKYDLTAEKAFITRANINTLLEKNGICGDIGILSIDIDGNDYWVWQAIEVVSPDIVIAEYNSVYGSKNAVTIPYQADFDRTKAHFSHLYWGCSLKALALLAEEKGYYFIGCNSAGVNAYFVKKEKIGNLAIADPEKGYVLSKCKDARDENGNMSFLAGNDRARIMKEMPLVDIEKNTTVAIADLDLRA